MIALVFARFGYAGRPGVILSVTGYVQGGILLLCSLIMHGMGMSGAAVLLGVASLCSVLGAARVQARILYPAATLLLMSAFGWQAIEQPEKMRATFLLINVGGSILLTVLALLITPPTRRNRTREEAEAPPEQG